MSKFTRFWKVSLSALCLLLVSSNLDAKPRKQKPVPPTKKTKEVAEIRKPIPPKKTEEVAKIDIDKLAHDGVEICYNAYAQSYAQRVAQENENLAAMNALSSSYARLIPIQAAKDFATAIINQLVVLTPSLSVQEKNDFWNASEQHIKVVLDGFCKAYGSQSTGDLDAHIANQIKMKRTFR